MLNWTWHFITLWFCTAQHVILCGTVLDKTVKVKNKFKLHTSFIMYIMYNMYNLICKLDCIYELNSN